MAKPFLFADHPAAAKADKGTLEEFTDRMRTDAELAEVGKEVLQIVRHTLGTATDEEIAAYTDKGRGADFTAVRLYMDHGADDMLRLHVYPRSTRDGEFHGHSRRVISTVAAGTILNATARAELCAPAESEFDVWDCRIVDDACVPELSTEVGARLRREGEVLVPAGTSYEVPIDQYHRIAVGAGTVTMCWFASTGMEESLGTGRILKPRNTMPEPIPTLQPADIQDVRTAISI